MGLQTGRTDPWGLRDYAESGRDDIPPSDG